MRNPLTRESLAPMSLPEKTPSEALHTTGQACPETAVTREEESKTAIQSGECQINASGKSRGRGGPFAVSHKSERGF